VANVARIRVESKQLHPRASDDQKDAAFRGMMAAFKRQVNEMGLISEYRARQAYESKGEKRRRKRKEAATQRRKEAGLQTRLREYFG